MNIYYVIRIENNVKMNNEHPLSIYPSKHNK